MNLKSSSNKPKATRKARAAGKRPPKAATRGGKSSVAPKPTGGKSRRKATTITAPPSPEVLLVGRPTLARLMGVHDDTISKFSRLGMPVHTQGGHGAESSYDAFACLAWQRERQPLGAKDAAQARLYEANAQNAEQRLRRDRGLLVSREAVERAGQAIVAGLRAKVLSLPVRLRHQGFITREQEAGVRELCRADLKDIETWELVAQAVQVATPSEEAAAS